MSDDVWLIGIAVMAFILCLLWLRKKTRPKQEHVKGDDLPIWPFEPMPVMTDSEVLFFKKLQIALPEFLIFSQVQLSRIIEPSEEAGSDRQFWFNRVCRQSVDFVLVRADCQTVLAAIELDDWTHDSVVRQKQDAKKDKALSSAGIPIIRFHASAMPTAEMIRHDVIEVVRRFG
ncbi:DUF2726 domain-containing protein [Moraxella nasovis]|uniref:DUF2726 domain-containing protein n=1 Tax=Moraxella nasovis TaxID=2904121 RepID=UPI001F61F78F|nr:DUF2726 domain-containing protein [Moraxella nasovis]UNU72888.1 DUF2726 domain-containing protein [Moraxella nasovis]